MVEPHSDLPLSPLRKVIAARMTEAVRTVPHFRLVADLEMDALLAHRAELNGAAPAQQVSINDCLVKACAMTLMEHPDINCEFVDGKVRRHHQADISIVVAVEGGLATPVLRAANARSVRDIAAEAKALATRAMAGKLRMDEIIDGSFSISNLGSYGVEEFDAIINPPQCAILAVGCAKRRVIAVSDREMRIATMARVTLSVDHRVADGVVGAAFLATLRNRIEDPQAIFHS